MCLHCNDRTLLDVSQLLRSHPAGSAEHVMDAGTRTLSGFGLFIWSSLYRGKRLSLPVAGNACQEHIQNQIERQSVAGPKQASSNRTHEYPICIGGKMGIVVTLTPDDLDDVIACFSPGVGAVAYFEATRPARELPFGRCIC